jgi:hypothetical protein
MRFMKYVMFICVGINIGCLIGNALSGAWGIIPVNVAAIMSCIGAIALNN